MSIFDFQKRINDFDMPQEVVQAIEFTGEEVAHLIRGQMSVGLTGNNRKIKNKYTNSTTYGVIWGEYRLGKNLQVEFFDLKVTGEFTSKIEVQSVTPESFVITSPSMKTPDLVDMFGEAILKMTDESRAEFIRSSFFPELKYRIENKLGVKFGS